MQELTDKQQQVLDAIKEFQGINGFPPTVRELAEYFGQASTAGIHKILKALESKGHLRKGDKGKSRSLGVLDDDPAAFRARAYPIVGHVQAGPFQLAVEDREGELLLDSDWAGHGETFLLRVRGHSMIDADIRDGDMVLVEKTQQCHNGDIVIALLEDEATVKRFFKEKDRIRLQPENPTMQAIYVPKDDPGFRIIGKVKGLLRKF
ncbi:transcriptional repressor LexA [candidate division KSB1 bacterium]|nr:transcriptional repressor LexA [candidate division KSB1 bacterium]